ESAAPVEEHALRQILDRHAGTLVDAAHNLAFQFAVTGRHADHGDAALAQLAGGRRRLASVVVIGIRGEHPGARARREYVGPAVPVMRLAVRADVATGAWRQHVEAIDIVADQIEDRRIPRTLGELA